VGTRPKSISSFFDIRDIFVFAGIAGIGYGLYLLRPWLGISVSGAILFYIGLFHGQRQQG